MSRYVSAVLTPALFLLSAAPASAQAFRPPSIPIRPVGEGVVHGLYHLPHYLFRGIFETEVGQAVMLVLGLILLAVIGWAVGNALGQRRRLATDKGMRMGPSPWRGQSERWTTSGWQPIDQPSSRGQSSAPAPDTDRTPCADVLLDAEKTAAKARETTKLLESLSSRDRHLDPGFLAQRFRATFHLVQQAWEDRDCEFVADLLTPRLFAKYKQLIDGMRTDGKVNRLEGLQIENLEFIHLCYPENEDAQEVAALFTFRVTSYYLDERTGARCDGETYPRRFQECWIFRRNQDCWKLQDVERSPDCSRLGEPNRVAGLA